LAYIPLEKGKVVTESATGLARESTSYRRKRSAERFFISLTSMSLPVLVALVTVAFLSRLLWPPLIHALWLIPLWIVGVSLYLIIEPSRWAVPPWRAHALADLKSGSRGVFMAVREAKKSDWPQPVPQEDLRLEVTFPWKSGLMWLVGGSALVAVLLLPDLRPKPEPSPAGFAPMERMEKMVAALREEDLAEESFLEEVEEALEELKQETGRSLKAADWQALDGIEEDLTRRVLEAYHRLDEEEKELRALRNALSAFDERAASLEGTKDLLRRLSEEEAMKLLEAFKEKSGFTDRELKRLLDKITGESMEFMEFSEKELALLKELSKYQFLTPEQLKRLQEALKNMDPAKLAKLLEEMNLKRLTEEELEELLRRLESGELAFTDEDLENLIAMLEAGEGG
jgi:Glu-tRNA(Gln) amidotransferase subunit E-like FAD-binding protein